MRIENRQLLKKQLEQQAVLIEHEQEELRLVQSLLTTCSALLRTAEKAMPEDISGEVSDTVYAGYLGIAGRIRSFYERNEKNLQAGQTEALNVLLSQIHSAQASGKELENRLSDVKKQAEAQQSQISRTAAELTEEQKQYDDLTEKRKELEKSKEELEQEQQKIRIRITELEKEKAAVQFETEHLESNLEKLNQEITSAQDTYAELTAYYSELERIRQGMQEEGYVNMESFLQSIQERNVRGQQLMAEYDSLLKKISSDVEALQEKIEKRRKPGVIG